MQASQHENPASHQLDHRLKQVLVVDGFALSLKGALCLLATEKFYRLGGFGERTLNLCL
jgi:hypothetical protein